MAEPQLPQSPSNSLGKNIHPDQYYIIGLLQNNGQVVDQIYQRFGPGVTRWMLKNNGTEADANDIFQEALIVIFRQGKEKQLELSCPFEAYLFLVVKRMWWNELKKRGRHGLTTDIDAFTDIGVHQFKELEVALDQQEKENKVLTFFEALGERCKEILRLCLKKECSQEVIAEKLGISYAYLRKKKSACMADLIKKVQEAPVQM